jgi:hypothetical protein
MKLAFAVLALTAFGFAQQGQLPTVKYTLDFPQAPVSHIVITVDTTGATTYESTSNANEINPEGQHYKTQFTMAPATADHIFELVKQANDLSGDFDYKKHRVAFTGKKTLAYTRAGNTTSTTFNWSENKAIDELAGLFLGISMTVEEGPKLQHMRRFDKLSMEKELAKVENGVQFGYFRELEIIAPILRELAEDHSLMHIARERARRLLEKAETTG